MEEKEVDVLLKDFYSKHTDQDISEEQITTIKDTYGDDYNTLLKDLYIKYTDSSL